MTPDDRDSLARGRNGAFIAGLVLLVATCALVWLRSQPPAVRPADAPAGDFSAARALEQLAGILGDQAPHPGGSEAHALVRERIVEALRGFGYEPRIQETLARGPNGRIAVVRNVVAYTTQTPAKSVLLCAHYDSVGAGPGAADDGAGVAAVLEIARALAASEPLPRPVIFLITDAEEAGLIGANEFAERHPWASSVEVVINLEARGTSGPSMLFETCGENAALIDAYARTADRPWTTSVAELVYKNMPNDTDLSVFRERGVKGFNFAFIGELWNYHTPHDDLAHLDPRSVQHQGDNALALVRELARENEITDAGDAVFFDVFSSFIVRWPRGWSLPLALVGALGASIAIALSLRRGLVNARSIAIGAVACCASPLLTMALTLGVPAAIHALHGVRDSAIAHPWPLRLVIASAVLAAPAWIGGIRLVVRAGPVAIASAASLLLSAASVVTALWIPEASYLAIIPNFVLAAGTLLSSCFPARARDEWFVWCTLPCLCTLGALWFPIALAMELGFHLQLPATIAGPAAIVVVASLPAVAICSPRLRRRVVWACVAVMIASAIIAAFVPANSSERPGWLNLRYIHDGARDTAHWEASTFGTALPENMRRAGFQPTATPPFSWLTLDRSLFQRPASAWDAAPPALEVASIETVADGRRFRCRIRSPRGAPRLHLHLPERVNIESVSWRGQTLSGFDGVHTQLFFAGEDDGFEITLKVAGAAPAELWLLDQDWTMPPEWNEIRALRPLEFLPRSDGDVSILGRRVTLD